MTKKVPAQKSTGKTSRGKRYREVEELRAAVRQACVFEWPAVFQKLEWEAELRRAVAGPDDIEQKAREAFSKLRSSLLDVACSILAHETASLRYIEDGEGDPRSGICGHYMSVVLGHHVRDLLKDPRMAVSSDWLRAAETPKANDFHRATEVEKRRPTTWEPGAARARLVRHLDAFKVFSLPGRRGSGGGSYYLNVRELSLVSLWIGIGVLDETGFGSSIARGGKTVADVIRAEEKPMRSAFNLHAVHRRRRKASERALRSRCAKQGREPTPLELEALDAEANPPLRGPEPPTDTPPPSVGANE